MMEVLIMKSRKYRHSVLCWHSDKRHSAGCLLMRGITACHAPAQHFGLQTKSHCEWQTYPPGRQQKWGRQQAGQAGRRHISGTHVVAGAACRLAVVWIEVAVPRLILLHLMSRGQLAPLVAVGVLALRPVLLHDDRQHRLVPRHGGGWRRQRRREVAGGRLCCPPISRPNPAGPGVWHSSSWGWRALCWPRKSRVGDRASQLRRQFRLRPSAQQWLQQDALCSLSIP